MDDWNWGHKTVSSKTRNVHSRSNHPSFQNKHSVGLVLPKRVQGFNDLIAYVKAMVKFGTSTLEVRVVSKGAFTALCQEPGGVHVTHQMMYADKSLMLFEQARIKAGSVPNEVNPLYGLGKIAVGVISAAVQVGVPCGGPISSSSS